MKRLVLLVLIFAVLLFSPVLAESKWTFQNYSLNAAPVMDYKVSTDVYATLPSTYYMVQNDGTNYVRTGDVSGRQVRNKVPASFTYAAYTDFENMVYSKRRDFMLMDAGNDSQWTYNTVGLCYGTRVIPPVRIEVTVVGTTARAYLDGMECANSTGLVTNPVYIAPYDSYGADGAGAAVDDMIIGTTSDSRYIVSIPDPNIYVIKKDIINPASSGLYFQNGTLLSSVGMTTTFGRSYNSYKLNETISLVHTETGTVYQTNYTNTNVSGKIEWNLQDALFNTAAPFGMYSIHLNDTQSDYITYVGNGATIAFDSSDYSQQDSATITYTIDGSYWDLSTYTYAMRIYDGTTWSVVNSQAISSSSGTFTYQFSSDDAQGVYYAVIIAVPNAGGSDIWMNYDYASLNAYAEFHGYVNDAETTLPISGANVSFSQNSIVANSITIADGNYTADGFMTGASLVINVTAAGYSQYYVSFSPSIAKSNALNITLNSTTPTYTGLGIGGIARDGILTGTTITSGYGRPLSGVTVYLKNTTNAELYTKTTSMTGWYLCDEGTSCFLTTKRPYDVWGEKTGYGTSPNYTVVTA